MAVGVSRYRYLRNPQHLFPRKDSLPRGGGAGLPLKKANAFFKGTRGGGSKQPAQLPFYGEFTIQVQQLQKRHP